MNLISYNCLNFKSNKMMIEKLINENDVCFFIEHWLGNAEANYLNEISSNHSTIFSSDFNNSELGGARGFKGRPFGGRCWVVRNNIKVINYEILSQSISRITIQSVKIATTTIYGIWQPFDDGSLEKLSLLYSSLSLLKADLLDVSHQDILILGDFNADFSRNKRFDKIFLNFLNENSLFDTACLFNVDKVPTYFKGSYTATLDHVCTNLSALQKVEDFLVYNDALCTSDHRAIRCSIKKISLDQINERTKLDAVQFQQDRFLHKFPWKNRLFCEHYASKLDEELPDLINRCKSYSASTVVKVVFEELPLLVITAARKAEKDLGIFTRNGLLRGHFVRCKFASVIMNIVSELKQLHNLGYSSDNALIKRLKCDLRKLQRVSLYRKDKNDALRLDKLLSSDKPKFWSKVAQHRRNIKKRVHIAATNPTPEDFVKYYSTVFSHSDRPSSTSHRLVENTVYELSNSLEGLVGANLFSLNQIRQELDELKLDKSAGNDGTSNEFYRYGSSNALAELLCVFFNNMVTYGTLPIGFNTSLLVPIPKKQGTASPADFRPISISCPLVTMFESLLLKQMPWLTKFNRCQFGYKRNTSCKTAFFIANETINYYKHGRSNMHLVSLDAAKAFDKLWRDGLFLKLIDKMESSIWRILYKYYTNSHIIVSVDGLRSNSFATMEGCKQGGILSPFLFNFFIDDLLEGINALNIGALIGDLNTSIIA